MSVTTPPPVVVTKKKGMGCFGCGCLAVVVALLLLVALIAIGAYYTYNRLDALTSTTPESVPSFDGGDDVYQRTMQKVNTFSQALAQNQPGSLELTADEINTLLAHEPELAANQAHVFVSMSGDRMKVQASLPTTLLPGGWFKGRFINGVVEFSPSFDPDTKSLNLALHHLHTSSIDIPESTLASIQDAVNQLMNTQLQSSSSTKLLLDHAKTIEVRDGNLEIETHPAP